MLQPNNRGFATGVGHLDKLHSNVNLGIDSTRSRAWVNASPRVIRHIEGVGFELMQRYGYETMFSGPQDVSMMWRLLYKAESRINKLRTDRGFRHDSRAS